MKNLCWCCSLANGGDKMLVQCSTVQSIDLESWSLQVGKSPQPEPGHVVRQLPMLHKQDLTGECQQIQK